MTPPDHAETTTPLPLAPGAPVRERADAAHNRRLVLDAAAALFAEGDPAAVTMEDIARRAGVSKPTLYRRYRDRSEIAAALLDLHERRLQEQLLGGRPPLGPGADPPERLRAFLLAMADLHERHGHLSLAIESEAQRLRTGAHGAWRLHVLHLLTRSGLPPRTAEALSDQVLGTVSPSIYHHQRDVLRIPRAAIRAGLAQLARAVTAPDQHAAERS